MGKSISSRKFFISLWLYYNLVLFEAYGKQPERACFSDCIFSMPKFDNNVLYFLTETVENFVIGTHVSYMFRIDPMFGINSFTDI